MNTIEELKRLYPACFFKRGHEKPLAVGLHQHLLEKVGNNIKNLSRSQIRKALHTYTHRPTYLAALLPNARRVNLEGQVEGSVSLENSRQAFWQLKNSKTPPRITRRFPKEAMQPPEQQHVTLQQQPASRKESATKEVVE